MKNILLLSTIYPRPKNNQGTYVCHFFAKEWQKMGYSVRVVHFQAIYPRIFYWVAKCCQKFVSSKTGAIVYTHRDKDVAMYEMDGVKVFRLPIFKKIPHGAFSEKEYDKQMNIISSRVTKDFIPDIIIGHFHNPQLRIVNQLGIIFKNARTAMVIHGEIPQIRQVYGNRTLEYNNTIDVWGFRSITIQSLFELEYGKVKNSFICYSGIPENYAVETNLRTFSVVRKFVYVGSLIARKYPECLLPAISDAFPNNDFDLLFIGDGDEKSHIINSAKSLHIAEHVKFTGKISRDEILNYLDQSDCFVMISKGEAFGLVYLEAMSRGCITIGSKKEGIDGVIIDGYNGFLCEAGNVEELSKIIKNITSIDSVELKRISDNAIATAKKMTDYQVAYDYIKAIDYEDTKEDL